MLNITQLILIKSTENTDLIEAVFRLHQKDEKMILLANKNSSFLTKSFEELQNKIKDFEYIYSHISCMFLKKLDIHRPTIGNNSFLNEIELMMSDDSNDVIYIHRLDTILECLLPYECEYIIANISLFSQKYNKKIIFSISNTTMQGRILEPILLKVVNQHYTIASQKIGELKQVILLKSEDNVHMIKSSLNLHQDNGFLLLSNSKDSSLEKIFKELEESMSNFDQVYPEVSCMFLKKSWNSLDKLYGKNVFLIEIQEMMQNDKFSTVYFHRLDTLFRGATQDDCEYIIDQIKELANYYNKRVIFSINPKTLFGRFLESILVNVVDFEQTDENFIYKPANIITHKKVSKRAIL